MMSRLTLQEVEDGRAAWFEIQNRIIEKLNRRQNEKRDQLLSAGETWPERLFASAFRTVCRQPAPRARKTHTQGPETAARSATNPAAASRGLRPPPSTAWFSCCMRGASIAPDSSRSAAITSGSSRASRGLASTIAS